MRAFRAVVRGQSIWAVSLGKKQGAAKRQRIFGKTKEEAVARAEEKLAERQLHGSELAGISATHRAIIVEWRDRLTPEQMRAAFLAFEGSQISTRTVATCVADYILAKTAPDERGRCVWSKEHSSSARSRFTRFVAAFGGKVLGKLIPGELEDFIALQGASAASFHRSLRSLFGYARRHRWIVENPFEEMGGTPSHDGEAKDLMTPAQFSKLLRIAAGLEDSHARREPLLAAFVLGGFCGLRTAEARRLTWGGIDLKAGRIELDRNTTRKRGLRGRFIELEPAALAWLRTLTPAEKSARVVKLTDKNFRDARLAIARAAKLPGWSHNIMRRSFASHHLALNEDGAKTAAVLGHTDAETTFAKYRVPARRCDGEAWFAIFPPTP